MSGDEIAGAPGALAALRSAVDLLLDTDFDGLGEVGFTAVIDAIEVERRRLDAVDVRLLAAADQAHLAARHCRSSLADLWTHRLRLSPGEARARVRRARDLGPRRTLTGHGLDPIHPALAAAQAAGQMSAQQLDIATRVVGRIPIDIAAQACGPAEALMVQAARHQHPAELARTGTMLLARLDPDGAEPDDERAYRTRGLHLHRRSNGSWAVAGSLTDETGLALRTVLDPLAAPAPAAAGQPDPRSGAERDHDAVLDLCTRVLRAGVLPDTGGTPVTILVRADVDDLTRPDGTVNPDGLVLTEHGYLTRMRTLTALAGDAAMVPVVIDRAESDCRLFLGRTRRLASVDQRHALAARDGGCCFPGCTRPSSWSEAHHIVEWAAGGLTDLDNLCLVCRYHHREFTRRGWRVIMKSGRPHWVAPYWLDPDQEPRLNTAHHLPEIIFTPDGAMNARLRL